MTRVHLQEKPHQKPSHETEKGQLCPRSSAAFEPGEKIIFAENVFRGARFSYNFADIGVSSRPVIQPKLMIGATGDRYEREADQMSCQVIETISSCGLDSVQRQGYEEKMKENPGKNEELRRKVADIAPTEGASVEPELESAIRGVLGSGQPLSDRVRHPMERAFGADFGGVRLHNDAQSNFLNQSLQARAFTTGQDIFLRRGEYRPESFEGQRLLAHELTHVVQQNNGENLRSQSYRIIQRSLCEIRERAPLMIAPILPAIVVGAGVLLAAGLLSGCSRSEREELSQRTRELTPDDREFIEQALLYFYPDSAPPRCANEQVVELLRDLITRASECSDLMDSVPRPSYSPSISWILSQSVKTRWRRLFRDGQYRICINSIALSNRRDFDMATLSCESSGATTRGVQ